jgi:hypothetical protein
MNSFLYTRTEKPENSEDSMDNHLARLSIEGRDRVPQAVQTRKGASDLAPVRHDVHLTNEQKRKARGC